MTYVTQAMIKSFHSVILKSSWQSAYFPDQKPCGDRRTAAIRRVRRLLLIVLVLSAFCIATAVLLALQSDESDRLEVPFANFAGKLIEAIDESRSKTLGRLSSFVLDIESYADDDKEEWPYVTIPSSVERAQKALSLSAALQLAVHHVVKHNERKRWKEYASEHN